MAKIVTFGELMLRLQPYNYERFVQCDHVEFTFGGGGYRPRSYNTSSGKVVNLCFTAKTITEAEINMVIDLVNRKLGDAIA